MLVVPGYTVQDVELLHLFTVECVQYTPLCHMDNTIYNSNDQVKTFVTDFISLYTIVQLISTVPGTLIHVLVKLCSLNLWRE